MFCPRCGQEQISEETRFCSRCGFLLTGVGQVVLNEGFLPQNPNEGKKLETPRKRGLKKGFFIFLLTFLFVPIIAIITMTLRAEPVAVVITAIILFVGGLLRMAYALMFESNEPVAKTDEQGLLPSTQNLIGKSKAAALPPQNLSTSGYIPPDLGNWRDTKDLVQPSITEHTTKLLEKDK